MSEWKPIATAPRDRNILICVPGYDDYDQRVREAWWKSPWDGAPMKQCAWETMKGTVLSSDVHATSDGKPLGATHWQPLPEPPTPA